MKVTKTSNGDKNNSKSNHIALPIHTIDMVSLKNLQTPVVRKEWATCI